MSKSKWNEENVPDQSGRVVIVTGANSGIGFEASRVLAEKGAKVILACRNPDKGRSAMERIQNKSEHALVQLMTLDLSRLQSVRDFAQAFKREEKQLDLLINNAGVMVPPYTKTEDGFELQFGTNHLGHFALTGLLLDLLLSSENARVVNVSSMAHRAGNINFDDLHWDSRAYKPWSAYGDSKIANLYFTYELQRKLEQSGSSVVTTAAHPGWTATDLQRTSLMARIFNPLFAQRPHAGAWPTLRAAVDPDAKGADYYGPRGFMEMKGYPRKVTSNSRSHDRDIALKLWSVSEKLTGVQYEVLRQDKGL